MPDERNPSPTWARYTGLGLELTAVIGVLTLLGAWVDSRFGVGPWGTLAGFGLGLFGGFYRFFRAARAAMLAAGKSDRHTQHDHNG